MCRRKRCPYCAGLFIPDARVGWRQKVCRNKECQAKRKKESQRKWSEKHGDYWGSHQVKGESKKEFLAEKATYMQEYRWTHPDYVKRDNERRNRRRRSEKPGGEGVRRNRRNQDERFVQVQEIKGLVFELLPCRNQDEICVQLAENKTVTSHLPAP